jgi:hypothetical protein
LSKGKVIVRHKVRDFNAWKPYFVGDSKRQRDAGFTRWHLTRNANDKNEVVVIFECDNLEKARPVFSDPSLAELMKKAGVMDQPTVYILEDVENSAI